MSNHAAKLLDIINASWMTQAVCVAAQLRIADLLGKGLSSIDELAHAAECDGASLRRLLRGLASLGICEEHEDGSFALCPMGELLRDDVPQSLRAWALWWGKHQAPVWAGLAESVRTGESSRKRLTGKEGYAHLDSDPEAAALFNRAMSEITRRVASAVARLYDFSGLKSIVDIGGGQGELIAAILDAYPDVHGVVFDLPHAINSAKPQKRCELVAGSFFESVPGGADAYLLKSVLHNWNDEKSSLILRNCRRAMPMHGRLLLVERIMPARADGSPQHQAMARSDLNMLVGPGGKERTEAEFRELLGACGFHISRVIPTTLEFSVVEASRAG